ncbi:MAG: menC [Symbiobacteriaceae bacterium]|jgi:O-succinylbenzoate synthase|nr:menC [Symbiobacteriaceae bacterium]
MRIEAVELHLIDLPLKAPFEASVGVMYSRRMVLVKVLAEGVHGWGEVSALNDPVYSYETPETAWYVLERYLVPAVLGKELRHPSDVRALYHEIRGHNFAKAGLENAVWDAWARSLGQPLSQVLGGAKARIEVGVSIGIQATPADLVRVVDGFAGQGYRRMKVKIKPGRDYGDLLAVRKAFPNLPVMADANSAYSLSHIDLFRRMDELNLMMVEQPLAEDDIIDHAQLQSHIQTPVCLDESVHSPEDARKALALGSCRIINIKVGRVGGLSNAKRIHDLMAEHNLPVWCGGMFESGVGRAHNIHMTTLPGFTLPGDTSASDRYYHEDIVDEPAVLNPDGTLTVPTRPGIGVEVVLAQLRKYTRETSTFKAHS